MIQTTLAIANCDHRVKYIGVTSTFKSYTLRLLCYLLRGICALTKLLNIEHDDIFIHVKLKFCQCFHLQINKDIINSKPSSCNNCLLHLAIRLARERCNEEKNIYCDQHDQV